MRGARRRCGGTAGTLRSGAEMEQSRTGGAGVKGGGLGSGGVRIGVHACIIARVFCFWQRGDAMGVALESRPLPRMRRGGFWEWGAPSVEVPASAGTTDGGGRCYASESRPFSPYASGRVWGVRGAARRGSRLRRPLRNYSVSPLPTPKKERPFVGARPHTPGRGAAAPRRSRREEAPDYAKVSLRGKDGWEGVESA